VRVSGGGKIVQLQEGAGGKGCDAEAFNECVIELVLSARSSSSFFYISIISLSSSLPFSSFARHPRHCLRLSSLWHAHVHVCAIVKCMYM